MLTKVYQNKQIDWATALVCWLWFNLKMNEATYFTWFAIGLATSHGKRLLGRFPLVATPPLEVTATNQLT